MTKDMNSIIEKRVVKRGNKWCVVHGKGKDEGKIIKCYTGKDAEEKAKRLHRAIMAQKYSDLSNKDFLEYLRFASIYEPEINMVDCFDELVTRKYNKKIDFTFNIKNTPKVFHDRWNRIKSKFNNQEIALIVLKSSSYEKLKELMKSLTPKYLSLSKPKYRVDIELIENDFKHLKWLDRILLVDSKIDGLRLTICKINNKGYAFVDPTEIKKSPNVSKRLPALIRDIEENWENNTVCDSELIAMKENDVLHRTSSNAVLNSITDATKFNPYMHAYVFRTLVYKGKDLRNQTLEENLKYLPKRSKYIIPIDYSKKIEAGHSAYIVKGNDFKSIKKIWDLIIDDKGLKRDGEFVTHISEGLLFKCIDGTYASPHNKNWAKCKRWHEIDCVVLDKKLVEGTTKTWNYRLGIFIKDDYTNKLLKDKKASKKVEQLKNKNVLYMAKSDNTNISCNKGDCLRILAEEVLRYETEDGTPYYSFYIGRAMENVREKKGKSDGIDVLERLSVLEPRRIPLTELARFKNEALPNKLKSLINKISNLNDNQLIDFKKYLIDKEGED